MKTLLMLLLTAVVVVGGVAFDLLSAWVNVAQAFFPVATVVFLVTATAGLVARLRA